MSDYGTAPLKSFNFYWFIKSRLIALISFTYFCAKNCCFVTHDWYLLSLFLMSWTMLFRLCQFLLLGAALPSKTLEGTASMSKYLMVSRIFSNILPGVPAQYKPRLISKVLTTQKCLVCGANFAQKHKKGS